MQRCSRIEQGSALVLVAIVAVVIPPFLGRAHRGFDERFPPHISRGKKHGNEKADEAHARQNVDAFTGTPRLHETPNEDGRCERAH